MYIKLKAFSDNLTTYINVPCEVGLTFKRMSCVSFGDRPPQRMICIYEYRGEIERKEDLGKFIRVYELVDIIKDSE